MLRVDVAIINSLSLLASHLERIVAFSFLDPNLDVYNKQFRMLASIATFFCV
jgi:hypothetical protein